MVFDPQPLVSDRVDPSNVDCGNGLILIGMLPHGRT